jgi:AcrR family transcriptional regulator
LAAAVDQFAAQGYDATSVSQVIDAAGVAKGGFYHHFASKQDLLAEIYGELIRRQLAGLKRLLSSDRPADHILRAVIHDLVLTTAENAKAALVFVQEDSHLVGEHHDELRVARRKCHDAVVGLVRDGQRSGVFRSVVSPEIVTFTIFGVINELPRRYRPGGRRPPAQLADELVDLLLAGLSTTR